jgi:hypothetical protein
MRRVPRQLIQQLSDPVHRYWQRGSDNSHLRHSQPAVSLPRSVCGDDVFESPHHPTVRPPEQRERTPRQGPGPRDLRDTHPPPCGAIPG